jgi:hypothetical protein
MPYKAQVAVCSEIHTQHMDVMWAQCRIFECQTWWYIKELLGFKRLSLYGAWRWKFLFCKLKKVLDAVVGHIL